MLITELDYLELVNTAGDIKGGRRNSYTSTYAFTAAQDGFAWADAGAIAIGENTLAQTTTVTNVSKTQEHRGSLEKSVSISFATANAFAATDGSSSRFRSTSDYSFRSYSVF